MISKMHRVEVVGPIELLDISLESIQELGTLHLEAIPLSEYGEKQFLHRVSLTKVQREEAEALASLVSVLEESISQVPAASRPEREANPAYVAEYQHWEQEDLGNLLVAARGLHAKSRSFARRLQNLKDDIQELASYEEMIGTLAPLVETHEMPEGYEFRGIIFDGKNKLPTDLFETELKNSTNGEYRFYAAPASRKRMVAMVGYAQRHAHNVSHLILDSGIGELSLPRYMRNSPFEKALAQMQDDLDSLRKRLLEVEKQVAEFYAEKSSQLLAMLDVCRDRNSRYHALGKIAVTAYNFIIWGWVPGPSYEELLARLSKVSNDRTILTVIKNPTHTDPPVLLDNPKPVKHFEPLLKLFPLPKYGTIDPTKYLALIFPPIFGLMLADIAYGVFVGIIASILYATKRHKPLLKSISMIMAACAFFTIAFGVLFGEFLGDFGHSKLGLHAIWQERFNFEAENKTELLLAYMIVAVAVGLFHIVLGLILGIVNSIRARTHGVILDSIAKIVGIFLLLLLVGSLTELLPPEFSQIWVVLLIVFLVLMVAQTIKHPTHGLMLPIEVMGTIGSILSYVRIMAVGLVSVVLAYLANLFGGMMSSIVVGIIIAALLHALNLGLGIIDPAIQGLRLNYVEFFSKFYIGGGTPYTPFRKSGGTL